MFSPALPTPCAAMLDVLLERHGIDFTKYLPGSLLRRITVRMEQVGIEDYAGYAEYLASALGECDQLFNTILINHTGFFRDPEVWATIAAEIVQPIVASKPAGAPLRIWSAGCATGQEPYSLAMLLAELLGLEQLAARVTIYATDVDADALEQVRQARYHPWAVRMLPPALLERYFVTESMHYIVREELRRAVLVERHDLLADAPPQQIDLLLCRNVLLYLNRMGQERVIRTLRGALAAHGLLVLGKAELAPAAQQGLWWVSMPHRIMAKAPNRMPLARSHSTGRRVIAAAPDSSRAGSDQLIDRRGR